MEKQLENEMKNEMEAGLYGGYIGVIYIYTYIYISIDIVTRNVVGISVLSSWRTYATEQILLFGLLL